MKIDLIAINNKENKKLVWGLGKVFEANSFANDFSSKVESYAKDTDAEYLFFYNLEYDLVQEEKVKNIAGLPGDVFHCGLNVSCQTFKSLELIKPTWMLSKDANSQIESSSYKLTLDACLIRTEVIRKMGFIHSQFLSQKAANLELGYRYMCYGVFIRYIPWLAPDLKIREYSIPIRDEFFLIRLHFKKLWLRWILFRNILNGSCNVREGIKAYTQVKKIKRQTYNSFTHKESYRTFNKVEWKNRISVIIPTLKRYNYLNNLLKQLNVQTLLPLEVIVIDQTPKDLREKLICEKQYILKTIYQEKSGQCSSRNKGLALAKGEYILFLDDDVEIEEGFIEQHAKSIEVFGADISSGVVFEPQMQDLPFSFKITRFSDVFPANNTLAKQETLKKSGHFDLAFEKGKRADHDLGMRVYLAGAFMVLNHEIKIKHHRAMQGGLREHGQRKVTHYLSRQKLTAFDMPSVSEVYLWLKYFSNKQVKEKLLIVMIGNGFFAGTLYKKAIRVFLFILEFPFRIFQCVRAYRLAGRIQKKKTVNKLLFISTEFPPGPGGIGTNSYYISYWLKKFGWQVKVVTPQDYVNKKEIEEFNKQQDFNIITLKYFSSKAIKAVNRIIILIKEVLTFRPQIIVASGKNSVGFAVILKKIFRLPLLVIGHADEFLTHKRTAKYLFNQADKAIAVSKWTKNLMKKCGIKNNIIEVVSNGADNLLFQGGLDVSILRKKYNLENKKIILTLGNVTLRKAQDVVIKAMPLILKQHPNAIYVMAGLPTQKENFLKVAREFGVESNILFTGIVKRHELPFYYNLSNIFILPSRVSPGGSGEGYGIVVIEAALCQRAAIVTRGSGVEEAVVDNETGIIVSVDSCKEIADAVIRCFSDNSFCENLGVKARERALRESTWELKAQRYHLILNQLVGVAK